MNNPTIDPSSAVRDEITKTPPAFATTSAPIVPSAPITVSAPTAFTTSVVSAPAKNSFSYSMSNIKFIVGSLSNTQLDCPTCGTLFECLKVVLGKLCKFTDRQKGQREKSAETTRLVARKAILVGLHESGYSKRAIARLEGCREKQIRRLFSGELEQEG